MTARSGGTTKRSLRETDRAGRIAIAMLGAAFVTLVGGDPALAHIDPEIIPDGSESLVRWYQPPTDPLIDDWDVEVTAVGPDGQPTDDVYVSPARALPETSCWAIETPPEEAALVRIRAVSGSRVSAWSGYTFVPEPSPTLSLGAGASLPLWAARSRTSTRRRPAAGHRVPTPRGSGVPL